MIVFDLLLPILLILSAIGGYRRGAVEQGMVIIGLSAGAGIALAIAPSLGHSTDSGVAKAAISGTLIVTGLAIGGAVGHQLAMRTTQRAVTDRAHSPNKVAGAVLSATACVFAVWFVAGGLAQGPFPRVATGLRRSFVVRSLDRAFAPPPFFPTMEFVAQRLGFPDALAGVPPVPHDPVAPPDAGSVRAAGSLGASSSIEVLGSGCIRGKFNEGSGFVVAPGYVVTAAHVVAGTHDDFLYDGRRHPADIVAIDTERDIAVLYAAGLERRPIPLAASDPIRGSIGAIIGFPRASRAVITPAAVRAMISVLGHDIYGDSVVDRALIEIQASVQPGESGGPFVLQDGTLGGVVVDTSVIDPTVAYAVPPSELRRIIDAVGGRTDPIPSGSCPGIG